MNILAVGAHSDDIESWCAGTLAKYAAQGNKVFLATSTNGNIGSATMSMEETARVRKAEAAKSASIIGAEYICLDYDDDEYPPYDVIPSIWHYEPACGMRFIPTDYVDITDYFETKMQMLACMESQNAWMAHNYSSMDYKEDGLANSVRICAEFRGLQAQCKYAEGFRRALDGMRTRMTERVLP